MTSAMKPVLRAGFTLIELMIVMSIVGILTSVAYPYFTTIKLKAKRAERLPMLRAIEKTLFQIVAEKDALVTPCGSGCSCVDAPLNPPVPMDGYKHPFNPGLGDWQRLGFSPMDGSITAIKSVAIGAPRRGPDRSTFTPKAT